MEKLSKINFSRRLCFLLISLVLLFTILLRFKFCGSIFSGSYASAALALITL